MNSSLKWILKTQCGWILGAGVILIYTSAQAGSLVSHDLHQAYIYLAPSTPEAKPDTISLRPVQFEPAPVIVAPPQPAAPQPAAPQPAAPQPAAPQPAAPEFLGSAVWGRSQEKDRWTRAVLQIVRENKRTLDRAGDIESFCPGYKRSSKLAQEMCWAVIMSAISKKESDFIPSKSFREPTGEYSVGLLAMSGHQCRNAPTITALKNATENLKCGTRLMAKLIGQYGCISCGRVGGGANWSVLRKPYSIIYQGRRLRLGKISEILAMTKSKFKSVLQQSNKFRELNETAPVRTENPVRLSTGRS